MSECEPLSRPTWVLGVISRKGALSSSGLPFTDFLPICTRWILLTDSVSLLGSQNPMPSGPRQHFYRCVHVIDVAFCPVPSTCPFATHFPRRRAYAHEYVSHMHLHAPPPTLQPNSCFYPTRYLGLQKEMVLDTLVRWYLSFCFSFSTPSYPGGLRRMSRSLTNAFNSFRISIQ